METYCYGNKDLSRSKKKEKLQREVYLGKNEGRKISLKFKSLIIVFAKSGFTFVLLAWSFSLCCGRNICTYIYFN